MNTIDRIVLDEEDYNELMQREDYRVASEHLAMAYCALAHHLPAEVVHQFSSIAADAGRMVENDPDARRLFHGRPDVKPLVMTQTIAGAVLYFMLAEGAFDVPPIALHAVSDANRRVAGIIHQYTKDKHGKAVH